MHWLRWIIAALALVEADWMTFDGARALIVDDYVTPKAGGYVGQLGPWTKLVCGRRRRAALDIDESEFHDLRRGLADRRHLFCVGPRMGDVGDVDRRRRNVMVSVDGDDDECDHHSPARRWNDLEPCLTTKWFHFPEVSPCEESRGYL